MSALPDPVRPPPSEPPGQRRLLTLLFADLCDSTSLGEALEAEDYAELLAALRALCQRVIPAHGGTVVRMQGDGVLAMFGHPAAREDDARHAVQAALDLHAGVRALRFGFALPGMDRPALHTGVHAGLVLVQAGDEVLGRYELLGNVPNVVARLCAAAQRDEIVVSDETLGPEAAFFRTGAPRLLTLRGREGTIAVRSVLARAPVQTRFQAAVQRGLAPLVGRRHELGLLADRLRAVQGGTGPDGLALTAAAGIGKTRLAEEALHAAEGLGWRLHRGHCDDATGAEPLQPFVQMLRALFGVTSSAPAAHAAEAVTAGLAEIDARLLRHRDEVLRLLSRGAGENAGAVEGEDESKAASLADREGIDGTAGSGPNPAATGFTQEGLPAGDPRAADPGGTDVHSAGAAPADTDANAGLEPAPPVSHAPRVLRDLFDALARQAPQAVFVDDLQWADDATRQTLALLRSLAARPIFVLATVRSTAVDGDDVTAGLPTLPLAPLDDAEAAQAIGRLLPRADPFVVDEIGRLAGGNPLYIEELCHAAEAQGGAAGVFPFLQPAGAGGLPGRTATPTVAWLATLIGSRVDRLPAAQAELVRAAAVLGSVLPAWLLAGVAGCTEDDPRLTVLADEDLLFPGDAAGTLRFKHGLTREVIYESTGLQRRRALHRQAAAVLHARADGDDEAYCEALAYHHAAGGEAESAARYAEIAGDKALAASALDRAQAHYRTALALLDLLPPTPETERRWSAIAQRLGLVCVFDPSHEQLALLRDAAERAEARNDAGAAAYAEFWLAYVNYALGESRAAIHRGERALAAARRGDDPLAVQICAMLGQAKAAACDYAGALPLLNEAAAIKRRFLGSTRPAVGLSYTLTCKGAVLGDQGFFNDAHACFDEAQAVLRGVQHEVASSLACWRGAVYLWQGRWAEAAEAAAQARQVAERVRSLYLLSMAHSVGAYADWQTTRSPEALQALADATGWLQSRRRNLFVSLNHGWLADAIVASGRAGQERGAVANALLRGRTGDRLGVGMACRAHALASAQRGDLLRAERFLKHAFEVAAVRESRHEAAVTWLCAGEIALTRGDRKATAAALDRAAGGFEALQMGWFFERVKKLVRQ